MVRRPVRHCPHRAGRDSSSNTAGVRRQAMMPRPIRISLTAERSTRPTGATTSIRRTSATSSASSRGVRRPMLEQAIAAAREAFTTWSQTTPQQRFDMLDAAGTEILARKDELGRLLSREQGKTARRRHRRGRPRGRASSSSSPARRCASAARSSTRCARASKSRSRASRSASSPRSRRGTFRSRFRRGKSRRRSPSATASSSSRPSSSPASPVGDRGHRPARRACRPAC